MYLLVNESLNVLKTRSK